MTNHAEELAKLGWQYFECPACGSEGARAFPKPEQEHTGFMDSKINPIQRPWVGLTDEELSEVYNNSNWDFKQSWDYERAIEDKLRSKNT